MRARRSRDGADSKLSVSVVVPTHNRSDRLHALLDSLATQTLSPDRFEVVIVDDGSSDSSALVLRRAVDRYDFRLAVLSQDQAGPAAARNRGWRSARAPLVAFTDDDCSVSAEWLQRLVDAAERAPGQIIQGRTEIDPTEVDQAGPFARTLAITEPGPFYATCNILYPVEVLDLLGGFDESYPVPGGEDTDLGWRAREAGIGRVFVSGAVAYHGVVQLGLIGKLRWALHWSHAVQALARHPALRETLTWGVFWKRSHALLTLAALGVAVARRRRAAALLCLPYLRLLRARCVVEGFSSAYAPYLALYDLAEMIAMCRGGLRYRTPVL